MRDRIAQFFQLQAHGTTFQREVMGGLTTFLAMSYIIFVQPGVLSQAGMDFRAVMAATCPGIFRNLISGTTPGKPRTAKEQRWRFVVLRVRG